MPWAIVVERHYCRKTADTGVGVTELELPAFEDELLHETTSTENTNAAKGKTFFIKGLRNKFQIVNEPVVRFAMLSRSRRLRFVRAETH